MTFTGSKVFNNQTNEKTKKDELGSISSFTLSMTQNPLYTTTLTLLDTGDLSFEGEYNLWQSDDKEHNVGIYKKSEGDAYAKINTTMRLLYNFGRNYFFNLGVKNMPIADLSSTPTTYSAGAMARFLEDKNLTSWAGLNFDFNLKNVQETKFLLGVTNPNFNGILQFRVERKVSSGITIPEGKVMAHATYPKFLKLGLEAKVSDTFSLFNLFESEIEEKDFKTEMSFGGLYTLDPYTNMKFRVKDDLSTTISLTRRFRNLIDFTFCTHLIYKTYTATEMKLSTEPLLSHVKSKFGFTLNLIDEPLI
jgi:hypothetical protein